MHHNTTEKFIEKVKSSLNMQIAINAFADAMLICSCGMVIVELLFIVRGYRVELNYLIIPCLIALFSIIINYLKKCYNLKRAALYADDYFCLNDALVSVLDFEAQTVVDGFHKLHFSSTETVCETTDVESLRLRPPWWKFIASCLIGAVVIILANFNDSPTIVEARDRQQQTVELSEKINRDLQKELKQLEKKLTPAEKKLLKKSNLDKLVNELKAQQEFKSAMRQYAKLEKMLNKLSAKQQFKNNQQLLNAIARQLLKDRMTKKLGQQFNNGQYRKAAEELRKLKHSGDKQKKLEQLKQVLEKMKKTAERLTGNESKLKDRLNALKSAIDKYDKMMKKNAKQNDSVSQESLSKANQNAEEQLDKLSDALEQQQVAESFIDKLMKMRRAMQQAQQQMRGMQSGLGMKPGTGGKQGKGGMPGAGKGKQPGVGAGIGSATAWNRRETGDELSAKGALNKIKGQQGSGPSQKNIENATSGSAISKRVVKQARNEFNYKMEEFIKRNDVPDEMKDGVKRYFSNLHQN